MKVPRIYKTLGQAITALRRKSDKTQQELADAIGISRASVANIERGEQRVFLDQAVAVASFFELDGVDELLKAVQLQQPSSTDRMTFSGDRLNRIQRREVSAVLAELLTES